MPVQCDVGLLLVLAVKPEFAPAVLGCASSDAVLDILKSLVESILDTSELLATYPDGVKLDRADPLLLSEETGANGDPRRASAEQGRALLAMRVDAAVAQIRAASPSQ